MNTSQFLTASNFSFQNDTGRSLAPQPTSTLVRTLTWLIYPTVLLSNGAVLLPFIFKRSLRTAFSVYVISLTFANFLRISIQAPIAAITHIQPSNMFLNNRDLCSFIFYSTSVLGTGAVNTHALIAINRIWAILYPLSYRRIHSKRLAVISVVILWTYTNVLVGIHPLVERLREQNPNLNLSCAQSLGKFSTAVVFTNFTGYLLPLIVALTPFPVMLCSMARRGFKSKVSSVAPVETGDKRDAGPESLGGGIVHPPPAELAGPGNASQHDPGRIRSLNSRTREKQIFLGMLTASVVLCYLPFFTYFALQLLVKNFYYPTVMLVLQLIFQCQAIMDASLFVLTLRDLRSAIRRYSFKCVGLRGSRYR